MSVGTTTTTGETTRMTTGGGGGRRRARGARRGTGPGVRVTMVRTRAVGGGDDEREMHSSSRPSSSSSSSSPREDAVARAIAAIERRGGRLTGRVEVVNRGGAVLRARGLGEDGEEDEGVRFRAFLPKSQMRSTRLRLASNGTSGNGTSAAASDKDEIKALEAQIGKLIDVKLMDYSSRRVVVSERALLKEGATAKLPVGEVKEVVVTSLSDFGAFVEVCDGQGEASGLEGLVHISEISWNKISHPRDAVKVGQREFVKVLAVNEESGRINFSIKQTQADPLMETLETIMPVTMPAPSMDGDEFEEVPLPGLPDICSSLLREEGIDAVIPGRQAVEQRVVSQDLELWLTNVFVEDGYNLLARSGRQVQEIHVVTKLDRDSIKRAIKRATTSSKK